MTEAEERIYMRGQAGVYRELLGIALRGLGVEHVPDGEAAKERRIAALEAHLADVRAQLRMLCEDFGDNDWDDDLHLGDVIDKHVGRHLHDVDLDAREDAWRIFGAYLGDGKLSRKEFDRLWAERASE